jgi:hypothetical protein
MNTELQDKALSTADFARAGERPEAREQRRDETQMREGEMREEDGQLAALFTPQSADDFRSRWDAVQIGFVDDPRASVKKADELVAEVMKNLAASFAAERERFEQQMGSADGSSSTEHMRVAVRRYRSFFERLLSL